MRGIIGLIALMACLGLVACKQGVGERCQVNSDCEDGLTCSGPEDFLKCEDTGSGGAADASTIDAASAPDSDATPTPDAASPDAALPDAALPDATPTPDAAP